MKDFIFSGLHQETATLLRKLSFEGNSYKDCGWTKTEIETFKII